MSQVGSSSHVINVKEPYIYRIPDHIARENPKLYQPQLVYLGPYSRYKSDWNPSSAIQNVKNSSHAVKSITSERELLLKLCPELKIPYMEVEMFYKYGQKECDFFRMMVEDGVFILDLLRVGASDSVDENDPFLKSLASLGGIHVVPIIKQDMLLLVNQVPFWFLEFLLFHPGANPDQRLNYNPGEETVKREELLKLIIKFYSLPESTKGITPPYLHILDIYRRGLISQDIPTDNTKNKNKKYIPDEAAEYFPTASMLYEAAIPFKKSLTTNLKDISYHRGTLRLPPILIKKDTVQTLANLIVFEKLHVGAGNEITSYVFILNCLIHNARDVSLLESLEVITHTLRDDDEVVKSIGLISNDVAYPPDNMLKDIQIMSQQLRGRRLKKRIKKWRLDLVEKYLNTPWGYLSVFGAILLFGLGTTQTIYAVLSFIHRKD